MGRSVNSVPLLFPGPAGPAEYELMLTYGTGLFGKRFIDPDSWISVGIRVLEGGPLIPQDNTSSRSSASSTSSAGAAVWAFPGALYGMKTSPGGSPYLDSLPLAF